MKLQPERVAHHDEHPKGAGRLLFLHLAKQVIADDVDQTRAKVVSPSHNNIDAVCCYRGQPSAERLTKSNTKRHIILKQIFFQGNI